MNPYISIIKDSLKEQLNCEIHEFVYNEKYYIKNKNKVDVVYFNWYENIQTKGTLRTIIRAIRRIEILFLLKKLQIKTILVIHNRVPHNSKNIKIIKWFSKQVYKMADRLIILSEGTNTVLKNDFGTCFFEKIRKKIYILPHPDYHNVYPDLNINYRQKWNISNSDFVYLFFGNIAPYKNVELIIDAAKQIVEKNKQVKFVIMGKCDFSYKKYILNKIQSTKNIITIFQEINDKELTSVIKSANVVVMPLDKRSSLNSTTVFLTLSCGVNIVCSKIAGNVEFNGLIYDYDYDEKEQHLNNLICMCNKAYEEYNNDFNTYKSKIEKIDDILKNSHQKGVVGKKLATIITDLVNN